MSDFRDQVRRITLRLQSTVQDVVTSAATKVHESIKEGSPLTGAPGQPVGITGNLKNSWQLDFPAPLEATISTTTKYAPGIEEGIDMRTGRPITIRSKVGGIGSVKQTRAAWQKIVDEAVREQVRP